MIDTTEIGYAIFYAYCFITEDRFSDWRRRKSTEDPTKTNEQYTIDQAEETIAKGREEAVICGIASLYDEWIETEKAYYKHSNCLDDEGKALQRKRILLADKVELRLMGIK